ncbi:hypothetical protein Zmor_010305 [Zophobas morio]|uniref:Uncharacterized protein n=1 Tax=Zophobas morio TaxID=2755281 RepID=A0AA38IIS3_9CUCU|nr:hypothetical protein Zmor_010305 [Zophobas morio]
MNLKEANISKNIMKATSKEKRTVRTHKLVNEEIRTNFTKLTEEKFKGMGVQQQTLEQRWKFFKDTTYDAARKVCGFTRTGGSKKRTSWWSEETKLAIKEKKKLRKAYLANSISQSYEMYKEGRKLVKDIVKKARVKEWEQFGEKIEENSKQNKKLFYGVLKRMRGKSGGFLGQITNKNGELLTEPADIADRWGEYFSELLEAHESEETPNNH